MDSLNWSILKCLQQNARMTNAEIGRRVGVSSPFMGMLKPFLEKVKTYDEVINCYRITGNENIVMEVILKNQQHLEQFIDQLIVYGETKTQIVLSHVVNHNAIEQLK